MGCVRFLIAAQLPQYRGLGFCLPHFRYSCYRKHLVHRTWDYSKCLSSQYPVDDGGFFSLWEMVYAGNVDRSWQSLGSRPMIRVFNFLCSERLRGNYKMNEEYLWWDYSLDFEILLTLDKTENLGWTPLTMNLILRSLALAMGFLVSVSTASTSVAQNVTTLANNVSYWIPPEPVVCVLHHTPECEILLIMQ